LGEDKSSLLDSLRAAFSVPRNTTLRQQPGSLASHFVRSSIERQRITPNQSDSQM
jgi:hypothetical protein